MPIFGSLSAFWDCLLLEEKVVQKLQEKKFKDCIPLLTKILQTNNQFSHAYYFLHFCLMEHNQADPKALKMKRTAQKLNKGCELFTWHIDQTSLQKFTNLFEKVKEQKRKLLQNFEVFANTCFEQILMACHAHQDYNMSYLITDSFLKDNGSYRVIEQIEKDWGSFYKLKDEKVKIHKNLAVEITQSLYHSGNYEKHLCFLKGHEELDDNHPRRYTNKSVLLLLTARTEEIPLQILRCRTQNPQFTRIGFVQCQYLVSLSKIEDAVQFLTASLLQKPKALSYRLERIALSILIFYQLKRPITIDMIDDINQSLLIMSQKEDQQYNFIPPLIYDDIAFFLHLVKQIFLFSQSSQSSVRPYKLITTLIGSVKIFRKLALTGRVHKLQYNEEIKQSSRVLEAMLKQSQTIRS